MSEIIEFIGGWTAARGGSEEGLDAAVWERFGVERTVLVVDMEGFTVSARELGVVHYLRLIQRMQRVAAPLLQQFGGCLVRFEADNLFAVFTVPQDALAMVVEFIRVLDEDNAPREMVDRVHVSAGMAHGEILLSEDDFFGNAVNLASKLGEDRARAGVVLVTETVRSMAAADGIEFREVGAQEFAGEPEPVFELVYGTGNGG